MGNNVSNTSILTSDGQATSYPAKVYWLLVSADATGGHGSSMTAQMIAAQTS